MAEVLLQQLLVVWLEFERRLAHVPVIRRLEQGTLTVEDYRSLLFNLHAQVVEGARWITRAASSFDRDHLELRSRAIQHALDEHRDYELLERDYVAVGGALIDIQQAPRNLGTEALAAYLLQQASQPNPVDLLGAMFIIEGLGNTMANRWAGRVQEVLGIGSDATQFLSYHGANDEVHLDRLYQLLSTPAVNERTAPRILKTARVVARLYVLQLEELNHV